MKNFPVTILFILLYQICSGQNTIDNVRRHFDQKNYEAAISLSEKIIQESENSQEIGDAYYFSAISFKKLSEPTKAIDQYLKSLEYYEDPEDKASVYNNIASIFLAYHAYENTILFVTEAINTQVDSVDLGRRLLNRAIAYKQLQKYDEAKEDISNAHNIAIALNNTHLQYRAGNQLGLIHKDMKEYDKALVHFSNANSLDYPKKTFHNIANVYDLKGETSTAIQFFTKTINYTKRNRTKFIAHKDLGNLYLREGESRLAIQNLLNAVELFPSLSNPEIEDIKTFKSLANCYEILEENELALATMYDAFELSVKFNQIKNELADKYTKEAILKTLEEHRTKEQIKEETTEHQYTVSGVISISGLIILGLILLIRNIKIDFKRKEILFKSKELAKLQLKEKISAAAGRFK